MTDKILFETSNFFTAKGYANRNGGKVIPNGIKWAVIEEALGVHQAIDDHNEVIEDHKGHIARLKSLDKHMDHLEEKVGPFGVSVDQRGSSEIAHAEFPAVDKHDFEDHMRKGKYTLTNRNDHLTTYAKNPSEGGSLVVKHVHDNNSVYHHLIVHHYPGADATNANLGTQGEIKSETVDPGPKTTVIAEKFGTTPKDKEEPDLHVMYQLRKALHSPSGHDVMFKHGGTARVIPGHAHGALVHYEMLKPVDKEKFQKRIENSYEELKRAVKEAVEADTKGEVIAG